ncbi:MAG TPA: hypothetical protein VMZ69_09010 [Saprospiraceae bacterium]|nr:hypothetical protein [Saprospiraceae bacterium]
MSKKLPQAIYEAPDYFILHKDIRLMELDHLGNLYFVDGLDKLSKYDTTGHVSFNNVNNSLGHVHSIDVGNPFKLMVFYRDQQTIVMLDNTLSEINKIILSNWDLHDITAANLSPDNALWLFDGTKKVLLKMDDTGKSILASDPFDIINPVSARPDFIYDADQYLLLKETGKPIAVFDDFGKYVKALHDVGEHFTFYTHHIVYPNEKGIRIYDISEKSIPLDLRNTSILPGQKVFYTPGVIYRYDEKGISRIMNSE